LPANSSPLGFNCVVCGRDYGSIQFLPKQKTRKINRERVLGRPEPDILQIPKRPELTPIDFSLRNAIIAKVEERSLDKFTKVLAALRRNGWQLLPSSAPLSEEDRAKLEAYASELRSRVEARKLYEQEIERKEPLWNVTEEVGEIDPSVYEIMKELSRWVTTDLASSNEVQGGREKGKGEIVNNTSNNIVIRWNPITMIRKYWQMGDPLRHFDFPIDFYAKVAAKHGLIKILTENDMEMLRKAFNVIDKYRKQFYDRNYRYTWFEWFWIARYAQAISPSRAAKMLLALDGDEQGAGGRISLKHFKDNINLVMQFWKDYFYYSPYFFSFLKDIHHLIEKDPELKAEYNKLLEGDHIDNDNTVNRMLKEHLESLQHKLLEDNVNTVNNSNDYYLGTHNDDFKAVKLGQERIRIYHSNRNYQKEMEEYKNGSRKEKPKKKFSCTFSPSELPMDIRIKLHKEGKVPII
jgi:hypothetical protein